MYNIKSERVRIGLSQDDLAEVIGVHVNTLRAWENGANKPGSLNLIKLCDLFKCSPDYLLGLTDDRLKACV